MNKPPPPAHKQLIVDHCRWVIDQTKAQQALLTDKKQARKIAESIR